MHFLLNIMLLFFVILLILYNLSLLCLTSLCFILSLSPAFFPLIILFFCIMTLLSLSLYLSLSLSLVLSQFHACLSSYTSVYPSSTLLLGRVISWFSRPGSDFNLEIVHYLLCNINRVS